MWKERGSASTQVSTTHLILLAMIEWAPPATYPCHPQHPTSLCNRSRVLFATARTNSSSSARFRVFLAPNPSTPLAQSNEHLHHLKYSFNCPISVPLMHIRRYLLFVSENQPPAAPF